MVHTIKIVALLCILSASIASCVSGMDYNAVQSKMEKDCWVLCGLSEHSSCIMTTVWINQEIVEVWYDNPYTCNDSILAQHKKQGESLIKMMKKY